MIVTVTPTIMDGTVVCWYRPVDVTGLGEVVPRSVAGDELASASRNGVLVRGYLHDVEQVLPAARAAYELLRANRDADLSHLATHRGGVFYGDFVPVTGDVT